MNKYIKVKIISFNYLFLNKFIKKIYKIVYYNNSHLIGPIYLPTKKKKITILRSPHVHKKSREQYILNMHKRFLLLLNVGNVLDSLNRIKYFSGVKVIIK
ncbi:MAG: 30S ribosomal protein S10 [Candidatus Shikimatogenerans sp. AspAUS03]|uniref:Small ribosomal subunit protein uS10 n=1 Tax=Candidatus Shikimatogenerans sp. AspAUS03 TaxID=3158563 RepID=A0AAU7QSM8_9FLAO